MKLYSDSLVANLSIKDGAVNRIVQHNICKGLRQLGRILWERNTRTVDYFEDFYPDFDRGRAEAMLRSLQIDPKVTFGTLSKGNREKVQLVLVMSRRARLYLLDEPIGGVDPAARDYILETIIRNRDPESTVLISTHLIADIEPVLDAYIFLHGGNVIRSGSMEQVRQEGKSLDQSFREVFRCTQNY